MIRRLGLVTAWLCGGHAIAASLYWLLLQVPESNSLMLLASVAVVALLITVTILTETTAILAIDGGAGGPSWRDALRTPGLTRRTAAFAVAIVAFGAIWWLTAKVGAWWFGHAGEIDAVLMIRLGWTRTSSLHTTVRWVLLVIRHIVGLSVAVTLMKRVLDRSWTIAGMRTLATPARLIEIAVCLAVFIVLPWRFVWWRPRAVPPTWIELTFVAVKLGAIYLLANVGWALILHSARRRPSVT